MKVPFEGDIPLIPALPEMAAGFVLFLIVWWAISKFVVPKFEETYALRAEEIQGGIEKAERAQAEAQLAQSQYKAQLATARDEAARIREEAKAQGAAIMTEMRSQAQDESARMLSSAKTQIEAERSQVIGQLRSEVGGLATTLAGRIVGESLTDNARAQRTVDRFIADLESQGAEKA